MKRLASLLIALLFPSSVLATAAPEAEEQTSRFALYAETDQGAAEVVIFSNFYTLTTDEDELLDEMFESLQADTTEAVENFVVEESQFLLDEEDQWWVEAGLDEGAGIVEATIEAHFYVESDDPDVLLEAVLDHLNSITQDDLEEYFSYYVKENSDSSIYGVVIITDLFGGEDIFDDVDESHDYAEAITFVKGNGIVQGYSDGTYRPENPINRAEFTKILIEAAFPGETFVGEDCFSDIAADQWYAPYVCFAKKEGIISGYSDGSFKPGQSINIAEALKITLETYFDVPDVSGEWYEKYTQYAEESGLWLSEWASPSEDLTRGAMAELIYRIYSL